MPAGVILFYFISRRLDALDASDLQVLASFFYGRGLVDGWMDGWMHLLRTNQQTERIEWNGIEWNRIESNRISFRRG